VSVVPSLAAARTACTNIDCPAASFRWSGSSAKALSLATKTRRAEPSMPAQNYRLVVKGELGPRYASAFEDMTISAHD
jgi:hypothetical protein